MLLLLRQPSPRVHQLSKAEGWLCGRERGARSSGALRHWLQWRYLAVVAALCLPSLPARAEDCIDVSRDAAIQLSGQLIHTTFPGPPDDEGMAGADQPESAYLLKLDTPRCFLGDEFLDREVDVKLIQLVVNGDDDRGLFAQLKEFQGRRVTVAGNKAFGAHTGHHHALVLLVVSSVSGSNADAHGSGIDVVQGFYRALGEGDGSQAASLVIPAKRKSGPLSAAEMSRFYGNLRKPLQLMDVTELGGSRYRATYFFETEGGHRCNGSSVVTTVTLDGVNLISRIVAENGC